MKIKAFLNIVSIGDKKTVRPMILWTLLEYAFRGAPYGILMLATLEIFKPLQNPGTSININEMIKLTAFMSVAILLLLIVSRISYEKVYNGSYKLCAKGRISIGDHLRKLSMGFFNAKDPGNIGSYLVSDYANIEFVLSHLLPQLAGGIIMPFVVIIFLCFINLKLALISASVIPLVIPFTYIARKFIQSIGKRHISAKTEATSRMLEYIQGIRLIKAFNIKGLKFERLEKSFRRLKSLSIKIEAAGGPIVIFASLILHFGFIIIILLGLNFLFAMKLSIPHFIIFIILGLRVFEPLIQALIFYAELSYNELSVKRIQELLDAEIQKGENADKIPENFNIDFKNVTFSYHKHEVLKNINLKIPEKTLTAFVGPSGSGKTTMTRLIARFWDIDKGEIKIGDKNVKYYTPENLLSNISIVFQDVYLFNDTIIENIRIGKPDADYEDVTNAARIAGCHNFIEKLPKKYETEISEGGMTLSGGEKQRISMARAILKDSPIILLDEATAALDPENELYIQKAINGLVKEKTVIVIAHRLNTVVNADKIVVLSDGKIEQMGNHEYLVNKKGLYKNMWNEQRSARKWKV